MKVLMLSLHTNPLAQPGSGDAGGMNVYVRQLATALSALGAEVHVVTAAAFGSDSASTHDVGGSEPFTTHLLTSAQGVPKEDLPAHIPAMVEEIAAGIDPASPPDVLHAHYWISGVAALHISERFGALPVAATMHTLAKVKNRRRAEEAHGAPAQGLEPQTRIDAEQELIRRADLLVANTEFEATDLEQLYGAARQRINVVEPGVDLQTFSPGPERDDRAEREDGRDASEFTVVFAGRLQPLKGPHVLVAASQLLEQQRPDVPLRLSILGAPSGSADYDLPTLIARAGQQQRVSLGGPVPEAELARRFRGADAVAMPSASESFGLVALEAAACGTPVLATDVGGLRLAVQREVTGVLVADTAAQSWADAIAALYDAGPAARQRMGAAGVRWAEQHSWNRTARETLSAYQRILR